MCPSATRAWTRSWRSPRPASAASSACSAEPSKRVPSASSLSRPRLVLATLNHGKARELEALLRGVPFEVTALAAFAGAALPEETADSYRGNALLKARAAARLAGAWGLGDDSGLGGDALGGAPGVPSARHRGPRPPH